MIAAPWLRRLMDEHPDTCLGCGLPFTSDRPRDPSMAGSCAECAS